jgi:chromosome partitioning protein
LSNSGYANTLLKQLSQSADNGKKVTRIISIANQKGGVGKTTTSVNLSASLSMLGKQVLLVDLDPQGNATMGCGINKNDLSVSIFDWLTTTKPVEEIIKETGAGFHLLPSNSDVTAAEITLLGQDGREFVMRNRLLKESGSYDYVVVDCPPALNILTVNSLVASTGILVPMQCEYYALEGLAALMQTVEVIKTESNPNLQIEGVLRTMYDPRNGLARDVSQQLVEHFGEQVFKTLIGRNVRLAEAPSHGLPAILYDRTSKGAISYMALAEELIARHTLAFDSAEK